MKNKYDVVIVGAGPMGIFTAYELVLTAPKKSVLLIEQGHDIYHRYCPIKNKRIEKCPVDLDGNSGCLPCCSITCGFGGAGAFSDQRNVGGSKHHHVPSADRTGARQPWLCSLYAPVPVWHGV